jgi:tripartite-type tricarboxylate transporter receptor subunit TctC
MLLSRLIVSMFPVGLVVMAANVVSGQDYPNKPLRILTSPAGGGGDLAARIVAQGISGTLGQQVIVDNRATILAIELAAKMAPDGYNLLVTGGSLLTYPLLYKAAFNVTDFSPISQVTREISLLAVHPSLPVKSVKDLIALAKARPGELNYALVPSGSANQLAGELFKSMAGVNIVSVPYKGSAPTVTAVISGEAQLTMADPSLVLPHVKLGRLRALAITSARPSALAPGMPTLAESGLPGYEMVGMTSIYAPARTPATIIDRLNRQVVKLLGQADVKEKLLNSGVEAAPSSPEELAATIKSEIAKAGKVIKEAGIKGN